MTVEELTHTADVRIRVRSDSVPALFSEAARGMTRIMYGVDCRDGPREVSFSLEAGDREELIHDFLSELLYLSDVENLVFCTVEVLLKESTLAATARGVPFDPERHRGGQEIKGVSYSGLRILKDEEGYSTEILFDV